MDDLFLTAGTQIPSLPQGETPIDSITGTPAINEEEKGVLGSVWDFYKWYWGKVGDVLTGDQDSFYGKNQQSDAIQQTESGFSTPLLLIFAGVAALLYFARKAG